MTDTQAKLEAAIEQASGQYYGLVVLAGPPSSGKTAVLRLVSQNLGSPVVNVNLELSKRMLELTRAQRTRQVDRLLKAIIAEAPGGVVLLDNLEILFDPTLEIAPLRLLQASSRNRIVVATWTGTYHENTLTYAEPGHSEFKQFTAVEAIVVPTEVGKNN